MGDDMRLALRKPEASIDIIDASWNEDAEHETFVALQLGPLGEVRRRGSYIDVTHLWQEHGRKSGREPRRFLELESTKEAILIFNRNLENARSNGNFDWFHIDPERPENTVFFDSGNSAVDGSPTFLPFYIEKGGSLKGMQGGGAGHTWMNFRIAREFARWLDVEIAIAFDTAYSKLLRISREQRRALVKTSIALEREKTSKFAFDATYHKMLADKSSSEAKEATSELAVARLEMLKSNIASQRPRNEKGEFVRLCIARSKYKPIVQGLISELCKKYGVSVNACTQRFPRALNIGTIYEDIPEHLGPDLVYTIQCVLNGSLSPHSIYLYGVPGKEAKKRRESKLEGQLDLLDKLDDSSKSKK